MEDKQIKEKYKQYIYGAKSRKLEFDLTFQEFHILVSSKCAYCGDKGFGVDRIDSNQGYYKDNVVPCCKICNIMKKHLMYEEFMEQCRKVIRYSEGL